MGIPLHTMTQVWKKPVTEQKIRKQKKNYMQVNSAI